MKSQWFQGYLHSVERFLLVARLGGFFLSVRDVQQLRCWFLKGIPLTRVLQGLTRGFESFRFHHPPSVPLPHHLNYYTAFIEDRRSSPSSSSVSRESIDLNAPYQPPEQNSLVPAIEHLMAEMDWLILQEERLLERQLKQEILGAIQDLPLLPGFSSWTEDDLVEWLANLDAEKLALYHSRLDESRRVGIEQAASGQSNGVSFLGKRAIHRRRERLLLEALRAELGLPGWTEEPTDG